MLSLIAQGKVYFPVIYPVLGGRLKSFLTKQNLNVLILVAGLLAASSSPADLTFQTSRGFVFSQINDATFGLSWKAPDGTLWSSYLGKMANNGTVVNGVVTDSPATNACARIGGSLPSLAQYQNLLSHYFESGTQSMTDQDRADLYRLFPDMQAQPGDTVTMHWTSDALGPGGLEARYVEGLDPYGDFADWSQLYSVRCLRP